LGAGLYLLLKLVANRQRHTADDAHRSAIRDDVVYAIRARTRAHINNAQIVLRGRTGCAAGGSEDAQGPAIWRPRLRVGRLRFGSGTASPQAVLCAGRQLVMSLDTPR
jgi:hypothetical protein